MNIFVLSYSPKQSAEYHCDKHVPKMILESAQMLCTGAHELGFHAPYKPAYKNHPCTVWARQSWENWDWLFTLANELNYEYKRRFNHTDNHKSFDAIMELPAIDIWHSLPRGFTPFPQCMPDQYKHRDTVTAYRRYYKAEKPFARWKGIKPYWYS